MKFLKDALLFATGLTAIVQGTPSQENAQSAPKVRHDVILNGFLNAGDFDKQILDSLFTCAYTPMVQCPPAITKAWDKVCTRPRGTVPSISNSEPKAYDTFIGEMVDAIEAIGTGCMAYSPGYNRNFSRKEQAAYDIQKFMDAITDQVCHISPAKRQAEVENLISAARAKVHCNVYANSVEGLLFAFAPTNAKGFYELMTRLPLAQAAHTILDAQYSAACGSPTFRFKG
ncbi:MAG TPA: hypothetical protein VLG38_07115 [Gammaproteobacteria bacterium]|nr:hypothetical protein [Gammaproteobacteria bacterium]